MCTCANYNVMHNMGICVMPNMGICAIGEFTKRLPIRKVKLLA